ncbi:MAG: 2-amino-4-hydroxy-6-hydroxymethyldihydropteridine diphosphokinase [Candidatus Omnitrophota bacterium]|nr:MAG: 2-amino-4-hydroxy-6-hydroxymethyldihydropteridine diphosphokinase [Candidatus Omnitrophota bacterium]
MPVCYLGIGSNLGKREKNIKEAIKRINALEETKVIAASGLIETEPIGGPAGQPLFLNGALKIKTKLNAAELLKRLKKIEQELGRVKAARFAARVIDLDILFYGNKIIKRKNLKVPHPRVFMREFVLRPLSELL